MLDSASKPETSAALQRRIVTSLQDGLPLTRHPYRQVAHNLGIDEQVLIDALHAMQAEGAVRRIGVVPNHYALGYSHNLMVVWNIEDRKVDTLGSAIGKLDFVSHCYRRPRRPDWPYNLFVMVHGKSRSEVDLKIALIREQVGDSYRGHSALKSTKILKKTGLRLGPREV
jgi:DNA-binding Lrp family transcriptional regulator